MWKRLKGNFSSDLAIDLGTVNTLIYVKSKGIVLNEPSVISVRKEANGGKVVMAVDSDAKLMLGRTPQGISAVRPMRDGVIADFTFTEKMLQHFIRKVHANQWVAPSPQILISVPCGSTEVERRATRESALGAGARHVDIVLEPMAAAIGAGLPVHQARGSMVLDIGGGTSEIAVLSLNGIVYAASIRTGGDKLDDAISLYVRRNYGILIGEITAERIKMEIGCLDADETDRKIQVGGRSLAEGTPRSVMISAKEMQGALTEPLQSIVAAIRRALELTPPDLGGDISESGLTLTGGGALLRGLDKLLCEETGLPVHLAEDPLTCVARGGGHILDILAKTDRTHFALQ